MFTLTFIIFLPLSYAQARVGFDFSPIDKKEVFEAFDVQNADYPSRIDLGQNVIRPFIGWENNRGRIELRGDFSWDQSDTWVEADHIHSHVGLLRLRLDVQKRFLPKQTVGPLIGFGLRWDQGFAEISSSSTTTEEIDNALVLEEEIKSELNRFGLIASFGSDWIINKRIELGFRWDLLAMIRQKSTEEAGTTRRFEVNNDAVVTCGWKF